MGFRTMPKLNPGITGAISSRSYLDKIRAMYPAYLKAIWGLDDTNNVALADNAAATSSDIAINGGFEYSATSTVFGGWLQRPGTGTISAEAVLVHGGSSSCKLVRGADDNTWVYQDFVVAPGQSYAVSFFTQGDGTNQGRYGFWDTTNGAWIKTFTATGVTAAAFAEVTDTLVVPATCSVARIYFAVPPTTGTAYFDDLTVTGITSLNGAYYGAGITKSQAGIGDGGTSVAFDGNGTSVYIGTNKFASIWDGDVGSAIAWGKIGASDWSDTAEFRYLFHIKSHPDSSCYVVFGKSNVANTLMWRRKAGVGLNTNEQTYAFVSPPTGWFCMGFSWDINIPRLRGYLFSPGNLAFTEVFNVAGSDMNAWGDRPASSYETVLAAGATQTAQELVGSLDLVALWCGKTLTSGEFAEVMRI